MPIRAVTFDAGGTLLTPWPSVGHLYCRHARRHGWAGVSPAEANRRFAEAWSKRRDFGHTRREWAELVCLSLGIPGADPPPFFDRLYEAFAQPGAWRVYEDVMPCLRELRARGISTAVVSNWDERLRPLLRALKLDRWFDAVVVSCEVGAVKPAPRLFRLAADRLKVAPGECLHVGDSWEEDFRGAEGAGFRSLWLRRGARETGRTISSLSSVGEWIADGQ